MAHTTRCPSCGTEIGQDAPKGLCPKCLAEIGVAGSVFDPGKEDLDDNPHPSHRTIRDYELLEELGHGGMGIVYRARQLSLGREVAFKLIKPGMDSTPLRARFDAERAALARMDHPNVARVIDAGRIDLPLANLNPELSTSLGRPYFVMELVQGTPITHYCDDQQLLLRERLELFMAVCHAIQHAHQKGVIHRDIKPSNVLVSVQDGKPVPKVIDFGVAKAIGSRLTEESVATETGALIGTLEYMSPEQAGLDPADIDTRSDIYALGILLYELLTGTTPLNRKALKKAAWVELLRLVREQEPPKPSARQTESLLAVSRESADASSQSQIVNRKSKIPPDIDWIVIKALDKDRARRYETATAFAQDVHRFLNEETVLARPPSGIYRASKWVRRNRAVAGLTASLLLTVIAGFAAVLWQFGKTKRSYAESQSMARLLKGASRALSPTESDANRLKILETVASRLETDLPNRVDLQIEMRDALGSMYSSIGQFGQAEQMLAGALHLQTNLHTGYHTETASLLNSLAVVIQKQDRREEALPFYREALKIYEHFYGTNSFKLYTMRKNLAFDCRRLRLYPEAERLYEAALSAIASERLQIKQRMQTPAATPDEYKALDKRDMALTWDRVHTTADLVRTLLDARKFTDAEPRARWLHKALGAGFTHMWEYADAQCLLGASLLGQKRYEEAKALLLAGCDNFQGRKLPPGSYGPTAKAEALEWLRRYFEEQGRPDQFDEFLKKIEQSGSKSPDESPPRPAAPSPPPEPK